MIIFASIIIVLGMLIGYISFDSSRYMIINNKKYEMSDTINRIDINVNIWTMAVTRLAQRTVDGQIVDKIFSDYESSEQKKYEQDIQNWFEDYAEVLEAISDIIVFDAKGNAAYHYQEIADEQYETGRTEVIFEEAEKDLEGEQWLGVNRALYSDENVVTMVKAIPNEDGETMRGILVVELNPDIFKSLLFNNQSLLKNQYTLIVDKQGDIICANKKIQAEWLDEAEERFLQGERAFELTWEESTYYVCCQYNGLTGWKTYSVILIDDIYPQLSDLSGTITATAVGAVLIALIFVAVFSHTITEPIRHLVKGMRQVEKENFEIEIQSTRKDEVGQLIDAFNFMVQKIRQLIYEVYQREIVQKNTEIKALQAQINPHFLYNTLDSINWMLIEREEYDISDIVISLGDILRYSIGGKEQVVELKDELKYTGSYLCIQKNRMEERLSYTMDIAEDTLQCKVPKLILQPVIENAVLHGIEPQKEGGIINVTAMFKDNYLVISVHDNGVGMDKETLETLKSGIYKKEGISESVGMPNIQRRLELHYGHESTMEIQSVQGKGTTVILRMFMSEDSDNREVRQEEEKWIL